MDYFIGEDEAGSPVGFTILSGLDNRDGNICIKRIAVAVPAVVGYNALSRANRVLTARLDAFAYELHTFVCMGHALGHGTAASAGSAVQPLPAARMVKPAAA